MHVVETEISKWFFLYFLNLIDETYGGETKKTGAFDVHNFTIFLQSIYKENNNNIYDIC